MNAIHMPQHKCHDSGAFGVFAFCASPTLFPVQYDRAKVIWGSSVKQPYDREIGQSDGFKSRKTGCSDRGLADAQKSKSYIGGVPV